MIIYDNNSTYIRVHEANKLVNELILKGVIQKALRERPEQKFEYANVTASQIADFIDLHYKDFACRVNLYRTRWPWSKAYATTYTGNYNYIGLNTRKLNRSMESIAGSIAHEWGHCLEYYTKKNSSITVYFNHGDNSPVGKDNTFQYWLGRFVKSFIEAGN